MAVIAVGGVVILKGVAIFVPALPPNKSTNFDAIQPQAYREISARQLARGNSLQAQDFPSNDVSGS
jgi:hypothetical protein